MENLVRINLGISYNGRIFVQIGEIGGGRTPLLPVGSKQIIIKYKNRQALPAEVGNILTALDHGADTYGMICQRAEHPLSGKISYDLHMPLAYAKTLFPAVEKLG